MIRIICSVRDSASGLYGQPIYVASRGVAMRSFTDEVNRAAVDNPLSQHPEDFTLVQIGSFDDESGELVSQITELARGKDVLVHNGSRDTH